MARNAEQALISSVLRDQDFTTALQAGVESSWFHGYEDEWEWIENYYGKHKKTPSKVAFKRQWPEFRVLSVNDTEHLVEEVKASHVRFLINSVVKTTLDAVSVGDNEKAIATMHTGVIAVAKENASGQLDSDVLRDHGDIVEEVRARKKRVQDTGMAGYPTGFDTLDLRTGGLQPGHLWIVSGRPGASKTYTMLAMASAIAHAGFDVQFDSLEMTRPEVMIRLQPFLTAPLGRKVIDSLNVTQGKDYSLLEYKKQMKGLKDVAGKVFVADARKGRIGILQLAAQIERNNPQVVFVDYLKLMKMDGQGDWQSIGQLTGDLKILASEYQVPIVVANQLNRSQGMAKDVGVEGQAGSDSVGQDADGVLVIQKHSYSTRRLSLPKFRHGPDGFHWYTEFKPNQGIYKEVSGDRYNDLKDADKAAALGDD